MNADGIQEEEAKLVSRMWRILIVGYSVYFFLLEHAVLGFGQS